MIHRRFHYPTTATLLGVLVVAALVTETASGRLTSEWLERVGFAPRDLWELELGRLFTSALVTHGLRVLVGALLMTGLSVGLAERRAGALWAMGVFWGIHLATIVGMAVVLTPLHATLQSRLTEGLVVVRDVGPSAGYFGALGFGLSTTAGRASRLAAGLVLLWLLLNLLGWVHLGDALPQKASADLAHLVAFPFGWLVGERWLSLVSPASA